MLLFIIWIMLALAGATLGYVIGGRYFLALSEENFVHWKRLPNPPYLAESILAADPNQIYVKTAGGIYLNGNVEACLKDKSTTCWKRIAQIDNEELNYFKCTPRENFSYFRVTSPPVNYEESQVVSECGGEWYNETHYIRMKGGEMWVWQWGNFSMGMIGPFFLIIAGGTVLGLLAGLALAYLVTKILARRMIGRSSLSAK